MQIANVKKRIGRAAHVAIFQSVLDWAAHLAALLHASKDSPHKINSRLAKILSFASKKSEAYGQEAVFPSTSISAMTSYNYLVDITI